MSAGQVIGTIAGAIIGGPKGAYYGYMAGSIVDPLPGPNQTGPRLNDRVVQTSEDGAPLPTVFGTARMAGNVIWSTGLGDVAVTHEQEGGGSGGGSSATTTTYNKRTDAAIAICAGEITGIRRIWADAKLIYDVGEGASIDTLIASNSKAEGIRIYTGSETQEPDPLIQAYEDVNACPAFRGTAYVVFEDLQLADYGNRLPNLSFEVVRTGGAAAAELDSTVTHDTGSLNMLTRCASYADENGVYIWTVESGGAVTIDLCPTGTGSMMRHKTFTASTHYTTIGWLSGSYAVAKGVSDINAIAIPITNTANGIGVIKENGDYDEYMAPGAAYPAHCFAIKNGYIYYAARRTLGVIDDYLYKANIQSKEVEQISLYSTGKIYSIRVTNNYIWIAIGNNIESYDVNTLANVSSDATLSSSRMSYCMGVTSDDYIIYGNPSGNGVKKHSFITGDTKTIFNGAHTYGAATHFYGSSFHVIGDNLALIYWDAPNGYFYGSVEFWKTAGITTSSPALSTVAAEIISASGLDASQYDVSALAADTSRGYIVSRPMSARAALEPLQTAYHFDLAERDGKIHAVKRGGAVVATIPADDLGAAESPGAVPMRLTRHNETELPSEVQVSYSDPDNDHQAGTQYARSLTARHTNIQQISLPISMTSQEAARLAEVILNSALYTGRHSLAFDLSYSWARLSPADVVSVPGYGVQWQARIGQIDIGMPGIVQVQASPEVASLYASILSGNDPTGIGQTIGLTGPTTLTMLDCALLRDDDNSLGWYVGLSGVLDTWPGGLLYKSNDGGATWTRAISAARVQSAPIGTTATALAAADCRVWDKTNRLTVRMQGGAQLASTTEANLLAGANSALLGAAGRWEIIQYLTADLNVDGTYTLSDLLRGRKGTEHAAASHSVGDTLVVLDSASLQNLPAASAELNAARDYKSLTLGQALEAVDSTSHTNTGERLRCLAPVLMGGGRDASGNVTLKWVRRDRINSGWNNYADVPMSEATEAYEVDIYTSSAHSTLKRTITGLASATASYTSAQQVTDFGGNQATVYARVYQISATTGRGHYLQGSI